MRSSRHFVAFLAASLFTAGCVEAFGDKDPHRPGEPLGTYHLVAKQTSNDCGDQALGAPAAWEFDVKLSWGTGDLFWNSGGEVISGPVTDAGAFQIDTDVIEDMRTATEKGKPACSIARHDTAKGALKLTADGEGATSATGTLTYAFQPTDGSSCGDLVTSDTPLFATLPCAMKYTFTATRTGDY
ncbi:MAG: hypothetical protein U0441_28780 [Polyangiaceae bacterium]